MRGQYSRYTDRRAAKCECVSIVRAGLLDQRRLRPGHLGRAAGRDLRRRRHGVALDRATTPIKTGASFTYDVTKQLFAPLQNGVYRFAGSPAVAPTPFQFTQAFALVPEARLMFPKAYVLAGFFQDDWRVRNNLTLNLGLRYDVEFIKDIPDWPAPTDKNNLDPRLGFAWDPKGDQKWAVRGGFGGFTQQHAIFTIVKGGVGGRNGLVTLIADADRPAVPDVPERAAGVPAGRGAAGARHPGDLTRPRERARVDRRASASSISSARAPAWRWTPTSTAASSRDSST